MVRKLIIGVVVVGALARAQDIALDNSFRAEVRPVMQSLTNDVWSIVHTLFQAEPPLKVPVSCHFNPGGPPITKSDDWKNPKAITIDVTVDLAFDQFAYQLGH